MQQEFVYETRLDMCSVDFMGTWQPGAAFRAMQEAADGHCQLLNLTYERLREQGVAWVLSRMHMQLDEAPTFGQTVTVRTWPGPTRHMFFPRYFTFEAEGRELGRASSLYVLLDLQTRKIALPSRLKDPVPFSERPAPLPFPGNLRALAGEASERVYLPQYLDLDMNGHVNNTRYVDWFLNQFPVSRHQAQRLSDVLVHYNQEVRPEDELVLALREEGNVSALTGLHHGAACFAVEGTWKQR